MAVVKAPERVETARLILRRPRPNDATSLFSRYASDPEVTRHLGWPRHESVNATRTFLEFADAEWERWPAGPYLVESRADGRLLGSSGFRFETPQRASTGYAFARDAWGHGYATESVAAIVEIARGVGIVRLFAICHVDHAASARVLEKCGFAREGILRRHSVFPNLESEAPQDVLCYSRILE